MKIKSLKTLTLAAASVIAVLPNVVSAHGYTTFPQARQGFCLDQGGYWHPADGSAIPNAACRAAFLESGHYPFTQAPEFAANVPDYHNQAAVEAAVPDGTLCAAGDPNKSGMNIPSPDWQRTNVTPDANGNMQLVFKAHTPHNPSFWKIYLTKPGFDGATKSPTWADMELIQEHADLPLSQVNGHSAYEMDVAIPQGRDGDAILYVRWQRVDAVGEGFYSCSDITISGSGTYEPTWTAIDYYIKQGQSANVGDTVRARLFSETGQELINEVLAIDSTNVNNWQESLANTLVSDYSTLIEVGVEDAQGEITFDSSDIPSNQIWVQNTNYTFNLTVAPPVQNTAPSVDAIGDISLEEGNSVNISVNATDAQGDTLTYQWTAGADITISGSGANVTLNAGQVSADTANQVSVSVSDGQLSTAQSFTVTVTDSPEPVCAADAWDASKEYFAGAKVSKDGIEYSAKWWSKGEDPQTSGEWGAWAVVGPC